MLVIASKNFNIFFISLNNSKPFLLGISIASIFVISISYFTFNLTYRELTQLVIIILIFDLIIFYLIGSKRRKEIEEIKLIIKKIRKNLINSIDEIKLSNSLSDLEGNIKGMFKRTELDLANMKKLAQARTEFLGYVSHELRTPVFTIQGYLETLLNGAIDDTKVNKAFLKKALDHTENLNTLLSDLIEISMIESGLMSLSFRYFNLFNFLSEILSEVKNYNLNKDLEISLNDFNKKIEIYGDKNRLKQVMLNLISNAIKYTKNGKIELIVKEQLKNTVVISVKDTGIGIPKEDIERIFERFYRTERERASSIPGTGLGLAIVKHILEAHNSLIEVKSELNKGSEFSFKLKKV